MGFSVKRTMDVAQKLYEGIQLDDKSGPTALITYMRTDSLRIADEAIKKQESISYENMAKNIYLLRSNYILKEKHKMRMKQLDQLM